MIITTTGRIRDDFYVAGSEATPVYLLDGPAPLIFDAGFTAFSSRYASDIKAVLNDRVPRYLFLTHSHFDHIGAASHFKTIWPTLQIAGSVRCAEILQKTSAVDLIRALNAEGAKGLKQIGFSVVDETPFEPFDLDLQLEPDQTVDVAPGLSVIAMNTPGHTWDFMSYWIPEKKILVASEAVACYEKGGYLQPEFLVDFDAYIASLNRLESLGATVVCCGHHAVFTGPDAVAHFQASAGAARAYLEMVEAFLEQEDNDIDRTVMQVKAVEWDPRSWPKQPESAYLLNTRQRVKTIRKRMISNP